MLVDAEAPRSEPLPPESFPHGESGSTGVRFGPDIDDDSLLRLLGPLEGRRVLELGCGTGWAGVSLAEAGARVTAVDPSADRLGSARAAADSAEVRVELHQSDFAELAFVRADSIDAVLAVYSLAQVLDLGRVFRQLHRVLAPNGPLVISLPHPMAAMLEWDPEEQASPWLSRTYWNESPISWRVPGEEGSTQVHQLSAVFTSLQRANFRVDTLLEPAAAGNPVSPHRSPLDDWVPPTLVIRARKVGI